MKKITINDQDRSQWIDNDEGLYNWWRLSHQSKTQFIKENRAELSECIMRVLNQKPLR